MVLVVALALAATLFTLACARGTPPPARPTGPTPRTFVLVGSAGGPAGGGQIVTYELDPGLGDLTLRGRTPLAAPPAALAADGEGRILVAALARGTGTLSLAIDPATGKLSQRGRVGGRGQDPAAATVDRTGHYALVSDDGAGSVTVVAIKNDGTLDPGVDTFPAGKGAHGLAFHPSNQLAFVANRKAGTLSQFSFNSGTGTLTAHPGTTAGLPRDSGPFQVVCHPSGRITYVLNEISHTISVHAFDELRGTLSHMAFQMVSTLPEGADRKKPARAGDLRVGPAGRHLYATLPGSDALVGFAIDQSTGGLTLVEHQSSGGEGPQGLALDPPGRHLIVANRKSQSVAVFRLEAGSGRAQPLGVTRVGAAPLALAVVRPAATPP